MSPQEVRTWQGENSLQQRPVEETAPARDEEQEEDKMKKSQVQHWRLSGHTGVILQVCPRLLSPLYSLSVCSPLFWSWQIYSGRRQPPPATPLLTHGICQVRTTCRLPKFGTVAESCPLPLFLLNPQKLNSEGLWLLLPLLPTLLLSQVVLLEAMVPLATSPPLSIPLCAALIPSPTVSLFFQI